MKRTKIRSRNEIDKKYTWNLESMYKNDELWEKDFKEIKILAEAFTGYKGRLMESPQMLLKALKDSDKLVIKSSKLYAYAKMRQDQDTSVSKYQEMFGRASALLSLTSAKISFFTPELISSSEEDIRQYIKEEPALEEYRVSLERLIRMKAHILTTDEENILSRLSEVMSAPQNIYEMFKYADLDYGKIENEDGDRVQVTDGNYTELLSSKNRSVRRNAYLAMYKTSKAYANTVSASYNASVKADSILASLRGYKSSEDAALFADDIPISVYDNLIEVVHEYLPAMYKYIELRKKILNIDDLAMYDVYTPLVDLPEKTYTYEEAVELMLEALAPLGDDYCEVVRQGIEDRWIDVYENRNKYSGAYSYGVPEAHPFILMNFQGKLQDVLTLVHEMGHSMHSYYTNLTQAPSNRGYSIFVAEVASTVNENLLISHLLKTEKDPQLIAYITNKFLDEFKATVFRQTMFAEFERYAHRYVEEGGSLTKDRLSDEYEKLNKLYFGPEIVEDEWIRYEWTRIPHFYTAFYVYQYATGFSAATALAEKILEGGENVDNYRKFLTLGNSAFPIEELKVAGIDMSKKEPIEKALEKFEQTVDNFAYMVKKIR